MTENHKMPDDDLLTRHSSHQSAWLAHSDHSIKSSIRWATTWHHRVNRSFPVSLQWCSISHNCSGDARPTKHPYCVNPVKRGLMKIEAECLLQHGLARTSSSSWSSPYLLEAKSDGSSWFLTDGVDHPVSYISIKFSKHQIKYSTTEKETLALLLAFQHFEVYVGSSPLPVVVFTDHNSLVFLSCMYNHNQWLMWWALIVQDFNIDIRHKKGFENVLADALSEFHFFYQLSFLP